MTPAEAVRGLYEAYQARNWDTARSFLHADAAVDMPATGERLVGRPDVLDFQRGYPEPWGDLAVLRVVGGTTAGDVVVAAEIEVRGPVELFRLAAFWECRDDLLWRGVVAFGGSDPTVERPGRRPAASDEWARVDDSRRGGRRAPGGNGHGSGTTAIGATERTTWLSGRSGDRRGAAAPRWATRRRRPSR